MPPNADISPAAAAADVVVVVVVVKMDIVFILIGPQASEKQ